ncbi:hypothetical protein JCM33374_g5418 [Metschnikowia sp. JCM 33374]|nr:hypothetical protein JCM33374_g5418 [Metschnikowia sp. JCM 33374]
MSDSTITLRDLPILFSAFDTVLSLHYSTSITVPKVHDLCEKATQLTRRRIDSSTLERILQFDPQAYQIVHFGLNSFDYGVCTPEGISPIRFSTLLPHRRRAFEKLVSSENTGLTPVKLSAIAIPYMESWQSLTLNNSKNSLPRKQRIISTSVASCQSSEIPTKVSKGTMVSKSLSQNPCKISGVSSKPSSINSKSSLSNSLPRFKLKESTQSGGLSLLERIKLKEKKKTTELEGKSSENIHALYIKSKIPAVYDVLYELTLQNTSEQKSFKTMPMGKMVSIIKDSFSYAMTDKEICDTLNEIASLLPEKVKIIRLGDIHAIKIFVLDRTSDFSVLTKQNNQK